MFNYVEYLEMVFSNPVYACCYCACAFIATIIVAITINNICEYWKASKRRSTVTKSN